MGKLPVQSDFYRQAVPTGFTGALLAQAQMCGIDLGELLAAARFPYDPLVGRAQTAVVSRAQYSRLCRAFFRALGDESGGFMADARTPVGSTRLILLTMLNSPTLAVAMERGIEFNGSCRVRGHTEVNNTLTVTPDGRDATLAYYCAGDLVGRQYQVLCSLAAWLRFCGWLIGQHIDIFSAACAGPEPGHSSGLRHFLPCPVEFNQSQNEVRFSARHLEAPLVRSEADLPAFLKLAPYHVIVEPAPSELSVSQRIRGILGQDFRDEMPSFEDLTGFLNMSARTLRRRLDKEGTSYQRIKDIARRDSAITMLSREGLTVSEVAERVGFSDPSAFHRSFKKWTGESPGRYR